MRQILATVLTAPESRTQISCPRLFKLAQRLLASSNVLAATLPVGFRLELGLELLVTLYVAKCESRHVLLDQLPKLGASKAIQSRWLEVLRARDLVLIEGGAVALADAGVNLVTGTLNAIFDAQRALD